MVQNFLVNWIFKIKTLKFIKTYFIHNNLKLNFLYQVTRVFDWDASIGYLVFLTLHFQWKWLLKQISKVHLYFA